MLVQPLGEAAQLLDLAFVHRRVAVGVVADEHLREVRVELLDLLGELVPVLEVELHLARLLDRHRELVATRLRLARDSRAVLLVDEDARGRLRRAELDRPLEAFPDQRLGPGDAVDVADHLLERATMVEREDVELLVVAELVQSDTAHLVLPSGEVRQLAELVTRLDPADGAGA